MQLQAAVEHKVCEPNGHLLYVSKLHPSHSTGNSTANMDISHTLKNKESRLKTEKPVS
jgi:hypothetical protein